ncbi:MAG: hypothetical protein JO108_16765 [Acidobacteriaceae bacterium]|nr:hypothetical protein [Acidobacteriaceae bacterium]
MSVFWARKPRQVSSNEVPGHFVDSTGHETGFLYSGGKFQIVDVPGTDTFVYGMVRVRFLHRPAKRIYGSQARSRCSFGPALFA